MAVVHEQAAWPLMSGEPAMLVRFLIKNMEEYLMSGSHEGMAAAADAADARKAEAHALTLGWTPPSPFESELTRTEREKRRVGHGEAKERLLERPTMGMTGHGPVEARPLVEPRSFQPGVCVPPANEMTLTELEAGYARWHHAKYGPRPPSPYCPHGVILPATLAKLGEEYGELAEALMKQDADAVAIEAADMIGILFNLVRGVGRSLPDAIVIKLRILYDRLAVDSAGRGPVSVPMYRGSDLPRDIGGTHV